MLLRRHHDIWVCIMRFLLYYCLSMFSFKQSYNSPMDIVRDTYIGGITAITFSPGEDYIVYGFSLCYAIID